MSSQRIPDAEATAFPWWCILDNPKAMLKATPSEAAASMFAGPFFSRKAADDELDLHRHNYSKHAIVFCMSGHGSPDWRAFCAEPAPDAVASEVRDG